MTTGNQLADVLVAIQTVGIVSIVLILANLFINRLGKRTKSAEVRLATSDLKTLYVQIGGGLGSPEDGKSCAFVYLDEAAAVRLRDQISLWLDIKNNARKEGRVE